jgi:hypothetical protein
MLNFDATFEVQGRHISETMQLGSFSNSESQFSSGSLSILQAAKNKGWYLGEGSVSIFSHPFGKPASTQGKGNNWK